ncbi:AI-2E family transporter [Candidatus Woesearchaeota archaeon]|nr:AI-2E family transporter [Candidatus Woesearchaeota archaeon]
MKQSPVVSKPAVSKPIHRPKPTSKYLFILFFLGVLTLAVLIIKPFISTIIVAGIIVYVLYPVYEWILRKVKHPPVAAALMIISMIILVSVPLVIVTSQLTEDAYAAYLRSKQFFAKTQSFEDLCVERQSFPCTAITAVNEFSQKYDLEIGTHIATSISKLATSAITSATNFIFDLPRVLLNLFIGLMITFYMFIDGKDMVMTLKRALPIKVEHQNHIFQEFSDVIYATIYGAVLVAIVQGTLATIGYFIFGVTSPLILGLLTILTSFIPFLGAALVWMPTALGLIFNGVIAANNSTVAKGVGLFLYGALIVSSIDNFVKPYIISTRAKMHPLIILLGVFGGISLFGFVGLMIGPLLLALFITSLRIYEQEKENII